MDAALTCPKCGYVFDAKDARKRWFWSKILMAHLNKSRCPECASLLIGKNFRMLSLASMVFPLLLVFYFFISETTVFPSWMGWLMFFVVFFIISPMIVWWQCKHLQLSVVPEPDQDPNQMDGQNES